MQAVIYNAAFEPEP